MKVVILGLLAAGIGVATLGSGSREQVLGSYVTPLAGRSKNQRVNALRAADGINSVVIPAGGTFSFNQHVGSWSRDRGFVKAPVSYNGHLISAYGGAVCQTSTTLYNAALLAGLEVVERNRHRFAPSYVAPGRDAAVAFPDIDLRLHNPYDEPVVIVAGREGEHLRVRIVGRLAATGIKVVGDVHSVAPMRELTVTPGSEVHPHKGKAGFDVSVYRLWPNGQREHVSSDNYPVMDRLKSGPP
ncbi:MAG: VanW family protein [Chthonomonas sp.]|nr:VanW family protein [Chthonomonas sp.]